MSVRTNVKASNDSKGGRSIRQFRLAGLLLVLMVYPLLSQTERGNITGEVRDPSGAAIPGAEVTAIHIATNVQTKAESTAAGEYNVPIPPGVYSVTITALGFKR